MTELPTQEADAIILKFPAISPLPIRAKRVLTIQQMCLKIEEHILVRNINFGLLGQEKIGIIGKAVSAKSTFLKELQPSI